jgi:predicted PurR-regulated permease PerM
VASVEMIVGKMPEYANQFINWFENTREDNPQIFEFMENAVSVFAVNITDTITKLLSAAPKLDIVLAEISNSLYSFVMTIINLFVGIIVSIYVLKDKEKFVAQSKKLIYSILPVKKANGVVSVFRLAHEKFGNFITGKIFDSIIIGFLCFVVLTIFDIPYSLLVSVVVGVTNIVPFFGPFIGAIPSALLILCVDPIKCLTFIIIILLLQQFDGNILGPKILGSTTGVSSFWVLSSILVGSGLFGIWGMVCSVPMFAVFYTLIGNYCKKTLKKRGMDYSTETFERIDHMDEKTKAPVWVDEE